MKKILLLIVMVLEYIQQMVQVTCINEGGKNEMDKYIIVKYRMGRIGCLL